MINNTIECPYCKLDIDVDSKEIFGEKYIYCWSCSDFFLNENYVEK